jgi:hypothetical protein
VQKDGQVLVLLIVKKEVLPAFPDRLQMCSPEIGPVVFDVSILPYDLDLVDLAPYHKIIDGTTAE